MHFVVERTKLITPHWLRASLLMLVLLISSGAVYAQITTTSITDGRTPSGLQAGSPAGTYPLSDFDRVNLYNGNLNFRLPLLKIGGRGSASMMMTLALNLKSWRIKHTNRVMPDGNEIDSFVPTQTGWRPYTGYGAGDMVGRNYGLQVASNLTCRWYSKTLSRLTFSAADGTEYELRDQLTNGQPLNSTCSQGAYRGTVFVTADGSAATFISDAPIYDNPAFNTIGPHGFSVSGYLLLRDGARYRIDNGNVTWIRDRNGNKLSFSYSSTQMIITDSLNRQVTVNYNISDVSPYGLCDQIIFKGFGGAQRIIRVSYTNLGNALRPNSGYTIRTLGGANGLFPETNGSSSTYHDPTVSSAVWLPDGRSYKLFYNSYGELARVEIPTGGAYEYDMTPGSGVVCVGNPCGPGDERQIYRRILERRVYRNGGSGSSFEHREVYTNNETVNGNTATVSVEQLSPTGTVLARSRHSFAGSALNSFFGGAVVYAYGAWYEGNETQTETLATAGDLDSAAVLQSMVTTRAQRAAISWWPAYASTYGLDANKEPPNDPRITQSVNTIEPATSNLVSMQTFGYDDTLPFNNRNSVKEYGFEVGTPGTLLRETWTTFITSPGYTDSPVHLRELPSQVSIYEGNTERGRTTFEYDNYTLDGPNCGQSFHCGLQSRSDISGFDSQFTSSYTTRGNVTASTSYLITNGTVTGSTSGYSHYDVAGNVVRTIDPRSTPANIIATTVEYDDQFGSPDNEVRSNSVPTELSGLKSFAFPTKITNALGHTTYAQFDYYLGQPVNGEDANGVVASGSFDDALDRPKQVRRAVGTSAESQTTFAYDDTLRIVTVSSDRDVVNDNLLVSKVEYDQLGRTITQSQSEGGGNYIVTKTEYDALGRPYKTSNPFRPPNETAVWTVQEFDELGRVRTVTTPDSAVVSTTYSGNTVTVTDQAGKKRKSVTDALGRLTDVYEDPDGLNYQTSYLYDALDNLVRVTQGTQQRFFMYDSLKRLMRSSMPEQTANAALNLSDPITGNSAWSNGYDYDATGNLRFRTDARGVVIEYRYDALNRTTTTLYRVDGQPDPNTGDVEYLYDNATNGKGRLWLTYKWGTKPFQTVVGLYDPLGRITRFHNLFGDGQGQGGWSASYDINRTYNRAGAVTSQTYPSGHMVTYNYDSAGRLADRDAQNLAFTGNLGDGVQRTYASGVSYVPSGALKQERFGTTTPVYHKLFYNSRLQLAETLTSTTGDDTSWNRGKILNDYTLQCSGADCNATDNNGNLRQQQVYIPGNDQMSSWTSWYQQYDYDSLNRLKRVHEYTGNPQLDWQQEYDYDRWGNRTLNATNTWIGNATNPPIPALNETQFETGNLAASNRLYAPGDLSLPDNQRRMRYDAAGNLSTDTYTGAGERVYDAENRMTQAWANNQWQYYTYNADGQRTRRKLNNQETWQIYGIDGELVAEYAANAALVSPQKEYGYRNGELLITAEAPLSNRTNVALSANGATATASSYLGAPYNYYASYVIDGQRKAANENIWLDSTYQSFPDWVEIDFNGTKTLNEIDVVTQQDSNGNPVEPTLDMTFASWGITAFEVQYWNGGSWVTVPNGSVSGNNKVWRQFIFANITTSKIRVTVNGGADNAFSRLVEVEAWTPASSQRTNYALPANGGSATASSYLGAPYNYYASYVIDGQRKAANENIWLDSTYQSFPDWVEIDFNGTKTLNEIDVVTQQDSNGNPVEPTLGMTFASWGITAFEVQYWNGGSWVTVPNGSVSGNNKVWRQFTFANITTSKIRVTVNGGADNAFSRLVEVEAWGETSGNSSANIDWLVPDHLGTPRIILDQTGNLAKVTRHDYLPFGEELSAIGLRTSVLGYAGSDGFRQQFTLYERDNETGLDYAKARYYSSTLGRYAGVDPIIVTPERFFDPQQFNLYTYSRNSPLRFTDPTGQQLTLSGNIGEIKKQLADMLGIEDAARRITFDEKTGTITVDLAGIDLSKNEGAALLSDAIGSKNVYDIFVGSSVETLGGQLSLTPSGKSTRTIANLDNNPDETQYRTGKIDKDKPKKGVDDQIAINYAYRDQHSLSNTNLKLAPNWTSTFHELAEAYAKIEHSKKYAEAHQEAIERETRLRDQRPYLNAYNPGSGPGTTIDTTKIIIRNPK